MWYARAAKAMTGADVDTKAAPAGQGTNLDRPQCHTRCAAGYPTVHV
jgi:hypothetical protein